MKIEDISNKQRLSSIESQCESLINEKHLIMHIDINKIYTNHIHGIRVQDIQLFKNIKRTESHSIFFTSCCTDWITHSYKLVFQLIIFRVPYQTA